MTRGRRHLRARRPRLRSAGRRRRVPVARDRGVESEGLAERRKLPSAGAAWPASARCRNGDTGLSWSVHPTIARGRRLVEVLGPRSTNEADEDPSPDLGSRPAPSASQPPAASRSPRMPNWYPGASRVQHRSRDGDESRASVRRAPSTDRDLSASGRSDRRRRCRSAGRDLGTSAVSAAERTRAATWRAGRRRSARRDCLRDASEGRRKATARA